MGESAEGEPEMTQVPTHVCRQRRVILGMFAVSVAAVLLLPLGALVLALTNG